MRHRSWFALLLSLAFLGGCTSFRSPSGIAPTAVVHAEPQNGPAPLTVELDASASIDDGRIIAYSWRVNGEDLESASSGACCEHTFTAAGAYLVQLSVTDDEGRTDTAQVEVLVTNLPPVASCRLSNDAPIIGERVQFDASGSIDPDGTLVDFVWDFGDGDTMRGTRVSHVYTAEGLYTVTLMVEDATGAIGTAIHTITVHMDTGGGGCGGGGPISCS